MASLTISLSLMFTKPGYVVEQSILSSMPAQNILFFFFTRERIHHIFVSIKENFIFSKPNKLGGEGVSLFLYALVFDILSQAIDFFSWYDFTLQRFITPHVFESVFNSSSRSPPLLCIWLSIKCIGRRWWLAARGRNPQRASVGSGRRKRQCHRRARLPPGKSVACVITVCSPAADWWLLMKWRRDWRVKTLWGKMVKRSFRWADRSLGDVRRPHL